MDETNAALEQIATNDINNKTVVDTQIKNEPTTIDIENQLEKYDISPENLEKSSYDNTPNDDLSATSVSRITATATPTPNNETNSSNSKNDEKCKPSDAKNKATGFAFTIDFNDGKSIDNRKYKEIAERFQYRQQQQQEQRRHRRGVSLSKLDDSKNSSTSLNNMEIGQVSADDTSVLVTMATKPPFKQRVKSDDTKCDEKCDTKIVLRRPRPTAAQTQNCKDSSKRHSWSPRSSVNFEKIPQMQQDAIPNDEPTIKCIETSTTNSSGFQPKSTILQRAMENNSIRSSAKMTSKSKPSMAMNLNKKVSHDHHVVTAPLEYVRNSDEDGSIGDASQATYTLDGDNYTEEEKERMSIDKMGKRNFDLSIESRSRNDLSKNYASTLKNTIQMQYTREINNKIDMKFNRRGSIEREQLSKASPRSAKSYLDKIKTRVKTIGDHTFHKNNIKQTTDEKLLNLQVVRTDESMPNESDRGVFTSITACGVLNKYQDNISSNFPSNGNRKQSLTKFQIDSSEYIQPKVDESLMSSYTDYEKAKHHEYKLNIFSTISSYTSSGASQNQTDDDNLSIECVDDKPISIKTAPTKNDWIQEWAKNARRRNNLLASSATASPKLQHYTKTGSGRTKVVQLQGKDDDRMSQSYDTYFNSGEQFGDDVIENSSDECTAHSSRPIGRCEAITKTELADQKIANNVLRPPISPTKIPSPMHTQFRARSSSANRSFRNSNAVS